MILYDPDHPLSLMEFGILIPIRNSKASRTFENLKDHPELGPRIEQWWVRKKPQRLQREDLVRVHSPSYVDRLFSADLEQEVVKTFELIDAQGRYYRYDPSQAQLPMQVLFERILDRVAGSWQCAKIALKTGFCFYFGGGMHHAQKDFGNGFCLLNDIVVAVRKLQADGDIQTAWIIDVDAHKGDGTAALTAGDATITTMSVHMARSWPLDGPERDSTGRLNPSFIPSDIDVPVGPGEEEHYLDRLEAALHSLTEFDHPDMAMVVSGADPFEKDELPSTQELRLTLAQMEARDRMIYRFLKQRRIPAAYLMSGGYGESAWEPYTRFLTWALLDRLQIEAD
ncbi:MAG TPA: histone deacetylase [Desulfobacterales bacterium]